MEARVGELWRQYRRELEGLYGPYGALRPPEEMRLVELDLVLALSDAIAAACVAEAANGDRDEALTALLAAAAVEASVAGDIIAAAGEGRGASGVELEAHELIASTEGVLEVEEPEPLAVWLAEADVAFGLADLAAGGAADADYRARCGSGIDELIGRARGPAAGFALGAVSFGGAELFALLGQVAFLRHLGEAIGDFLHKGLLFLQRAMRKLIIGLGGSLPLMAILEGSAASGVMDWVAEKRQGLGTSMLRRAVDAERAEAELDSIAADLGALGGEQGARLIKDLDRLGGRWRRQMKCAGAIRVVLGAASPALAGSGGGLPLVAGLNTTALAYVLYGLAARLDTAPAPIVEGVPSIARAAIGMPRVGRVRRFSF